MLWFSKKQSYLGVDLGAGGVKVVELMNEKGRARLSTYGFTDRLASSVINPLEAPKETAALLKEIAKKARATTSQAVAALPAATVFSMVATVPQGGDKQLKEAVEAQAQKFIPLPLSELALDFKRIPVAPMVRDSMPNAGPGGAAAVATKPAVKTSQVLITGAAKTLVKSYADVFAQAGLQLVSLETEVFALIRSLIGKDRAVTMIVDIGALRTNLLIVENGIPYVTKSLEVGGNSLTQAMASALSVESSAAEAMKRDARSVAALYPDDGLPKMFQPTVLPLMNELRYAMSQYKGDDGLPKQIEKVILTGGSALLPSLADAVKKELGIRTYVGDPWARVVYPEELRATLDQIGPRFAVCVGLAMRDIE